MQKNTEDLAGLKIENPPATLREIVLERMRRAIINGVFEPEERLVERSLCQQLGVSRSVIREVIRHLEAEGLVTTLVNKGPIVARVSWEDARQIYAIRAAIESTAIADCARLANAEVKKRLKKAMEEFNRIARQRSPVAIIDATTELYKIIFEAGGHNIAWDIVCRLNGRISRLRVMTLSTPDRMTTGPAQIREIYEAIYNNEPDVAAAACQRHVATAAKIAESLLAGKD